MKRTILLSIFMFCGMLIAHAQIFIVDDAEKGSGLHKHNYVGSGWIHGTVTNTFYNSTHSASNVNGAYVTLTFQGKKVEWFTEKKNTHGIAAISIDGGPETFIDLYSATEQHLVVYSSPLLTPGTHTFKIRATGTKNPAATNYYAIHDYLTITGLDPPLFVDVTNTTMGVGTLESIAIVPAGGSNSAFGYYALNSSHTAGANTAVGAYALNSVGKTNVQNTAVGYRAMGEGLIGNGKRNNTAMGAHAMASDPGDRNTGLGSYSGPIDDTFMFNSTAVGYGTKTTSSNQVRIGNAEVTSIGGQVSWSTLSDGRFKKDLREDVSGLDFINGLRPVSYMVDKISVHRFLGVPDSIQTRFETKEQPVRQTGFVAQDVDKLVKKSGYVFNGVDVPKNDKDPYTIRYAEFVVPLVKAVQELTAKLEEQEQRVNELLAKIGEKETSDLGDKASQIMLFQNNPNPFSQNTEIKMVLPETTTSAQVIVYNLEGKQLKDVAVKGHGNASVTILGNELQAGMYIYALIVDGKVVDTKRMILTK